MNICLRDFLICPRMLEITSQRFWVFFPYARIIQVSHQLSSDHTLTYIFFLLSMATKASVPWKAGD